MRFLCLFGLPVVSALAAGFLTLTPPVAVTQSNFEKIQVGMSRSEVEAILGGPARFVRPLLGGGQWTRVIRGWQGPVLAVGVCFSADNRVVDKFILADEGYVWLWLRKLWRGQ